VEGGTGFFPMTLSSELYATPSWFSNEKLSDKSDEKEESEYDF
jgi:hypothetical protein